MVGLFDLVVWLGHLKSPWVNLSYRLQAYTVTLYFQFENPTGSR
jgi:hypothetical protein